MYTASLDNFTGILSVSPAPAKALGAFLFSPADSYLLEDGPRGPKLNFGGKEVIPALL